MMGNNAGRPPLSAEQFDEIVERCSRREYPEPLQTRFREHRRLFRRTLIVVQVLVPGSYTDPRSLETDTYEFWRDATPDDLMNGTTAR